MSIIKINQLTKMYGESRGILDVDLSINEGDIYGFIGPNGSGKSTTIKLLLNFIYPTSGSAEIFGMDVVSCSHEIKKQVGYVPSEVRYYSNMTAKELINRALAFHGMQSNEAVSELYSIFEIDKNKKIGEMSLGNKKKVAIACSLCHGPKLLILDEPTSGLDPLMQKRLFDVLKERNKNGTTIFLSSHNLNEVQEYCTKAAFIKEGKILKIQDLTSDIELVKVVTIKAKDINTSQLENIGAKVVEQSGDTLKLTYSGEIDRLTKFLFTLSIEDITITNMDLESKFLSYYEGDQK